MNELLERFLNTPSAAGKEDGVRELLKSLLTPLFDETKEDGLGNLLLRKNGKGKRLLLCAPMDGFGLIATHTEKDGVCVAALGEPDLTSLAYRRVTFFNGVGAVLIPQNAAAQSVSDFKAYIGETQEGSDEKYTGLQILPGEKAYFDRDYRLLQGETVVGGDISSAIGAYCLARAVLESVRNCENDVYLLFCAQDKLGSRGAAAGSFGIAPDAAFYISSCPADGANGGAELGGGAAVKLCDKKYVCSEEMRGFIEEICENAGIKHSVYTSEKSVGGVSAVCSAYKGCPACEISVPIKRFASSAETLLLSDAEAAIALIREILRRQAL